MPCARRVQLLERQDLSRRAHAIVEGPPGRAGARESDELFGVGDGLSHFDAHRVDFGPRPGAYVDPHRVGCDPAGHAGVCAGNEDPIDRFVLFVDDGRSALPQRQEKSTAAPHRQQSVVTDPGDLEAGLVHVRDEHGHGLSPTHTNPDVARRIHLRIGPVGQRVEDLLTHFPLVTRNAVRLHEIFQETSRLLDPLLAHLAMERPDRQSEHE